MSVVRLFLLVVSLTAVSFGGGNTLLAGLERELVHTGAISPAQFATAVALGQATPGPLASFTTAVGRYTMGWPGAVAATMALVTVSWIAVMLIARVPKGWFELHTVKSALAAITPYALALAVFIAFRIIQAGNHQRLTAPLGIAGLVLVGRLRKVPTALLMVGGVALGMLLQGTGLAGW
jgi:chromate transporter